MPARYRGGDHRIDRSEWLAFAAATDDPNPAYEGDQGIAPPMFHVRALIGLLLKLAGDPELEIDMLRLVHGSHGMRFHQPLRHGDVLTLSADRGPIDRKSSGTIFNFALYGHVGDDLVLEGDTAFFVRAECRPEPREGPPKPAPPQTPAPTWQVEQPVAIDQALRYADASSDRNPIHVDEDVARKAGLPGCILHGLCTMAFAQRDLIARACDGDPSRLASISVRFAGLVIPGQVLTLRAWQGIDSDLVRFDTLGPDGEPVISYGRATVRLGRIE